MDILGGASKLAWNFVNFVGMSRDAEANPWGKALADFGASSGVQKAATPLRDAAWQQVTAGTSAVGAQIERYVPGGDRITKGLGKAAEVLEVDHPASAFHAVATLVSPSKLASGVKVLPKVAGGSKMILDDILKVGSKLVPKVGSQSAKAGTKGLSASTDAIQLLKGNVADLATKQTTLSSSVKELGTLETKLKGLASKVDELAPAYRAKSLSRDEFLKYRKMEDEISQLTLKRDELFSKISKIADDIPAGLDDSIKIMSKQTGHFEDMITTISKMSDEVAQYGGKGLETLSSTVPKTALTKAAVLGGGLLGGGYVIGSAMDLLSEKMKVLPDWESGYEELKEQVDSQIAELSNIINQILDYLGVSADPEYPTQGEDAQALAELLDYLAAMLADTGAINGVDPSGIVGADLGYEDLAALYEAGILTDDDLEKFGIDPSDFREWAKVDQRSWYRYAVYAIAIFGAGAAIWLISGNWKGMKAAVEEKIGEVGLPDLPRLPLISGDENNSKEIYW